MSKFENEVFSANDFINNLSMDIFILKNVIKENQSNLTNVQLKKIEKELDGLLEKNFKPNKNFPILSEILIRHELNKSKIFTDLSDFDEKTEKLKKLEKAFKKEASQHLKEEIEKLNISRDIEKKKFSNLIQLRNDFNKVFRSYLKKEN